MTGSQGIEHPFRVLEISIIDDQKTVEDAYQAVITKYKRFENSPNPQERARYKTFFMAYKELKDPENRKKIIHDYISKLRKDIEIFLSGKTVIEKTAVDQLVNREVDIWGFDPELAKREIQQSLKQKGIEIGKKIVKEPLLVTNTVIAADKNSITLSWNIPSGNCDEILIIKRDDRFPAHANDGKEIFRGIAAQYRDNDISPGKCYYYAIFTLFEGKISKRPLQLKECIISPVSNVSLKAGCREISLQWDTPGLAERTVIIRQADKKPAVTLARDSLRVSEGEKIYEGTEKGYRDSGLTAEREYYYFLIAVFPGGRYSEGVMVSAKTTGLPVVPSGFSVVEKAGSVVLRWQPVPNAGGYRLLRKESSTPANENDGTIVFEGSALEYDDTQMSDGVSYFYALYSFSGSYFSDNGATTAYFLKKDPYNVNTAIQDKCIKMEWQLPPGAAGVTVRRSETRPPADVNEGVPIKVKDNNRLTDYSVKNGKTYHYTLFSIYNQRGKSEYSKGKAVRDLVPSGPPAAVLNIRLTQDEKEVRIMWDRPPNDEENKSIVGICITYSRDSFNRSKGQRMQFSGIKDKVIGWADYPLSFTDSNPHRGQIGYYAVFTAGVKGLNRGQSDFEVTFSGEKVLDLMSDVENVEWYRADGGIAVSWDWPRGCEVVYIGRSLEIPPAKIEYKGDIFITLDKNGERISDGIVTLFTRKEYQARKAFIDDDFKRVYYKICTAAHHEGGMRISMGKDIKVE